MENSLEIFEQAIERQVKAICERAFNEWKNVKLNPDPVQDLVSVHEIAAITPWSVATWYCKHSQGKLPEGLAFKRVGKLFFSKKAVLNWIKTGSDGSDAV